MRFKLFIGQQEALPTHKLIFFPIHTYNLIFVSIAPALSVRGFQIDDCVFQNGFNCVKVEVPTGCNVKCTDYLKNVQYCRIFNLTPPKVGNSVRYQTKARIGLDL